jgi:mitochondrial fission protein ELM1
MKKALPFILILASCAQSKKVENYRVTSSGVQVWRYSKPGEPKMDILSTGDTLVTTMDSIYIIRKTTKQ